MRTYNIVKNQPIYIPPNSLRARWTLTFTPSSIAAGNTGKLFVGRGFQPVASVGDPNQGDVLNSGSQIEEKSYYRGDPSVWTGRITITSDTDNQQFTFDEQEYEPVAT